MNITNTNPYRHYNYHLAYDEIPKDIKDNLLNAVEQTSKKLNIKIDPPSSEKTLHATISYAGIVEKKDLPKKGAIREDDPNLEKVDKLYKKLQKSKAINAAQYNHAFEINKVKITKNGYLSLGLNKTEIVDGAQLKFNKVTKKKASKKINNLEMKDYYKEINTFFHMSIGRIDLQEIDLTKNQKKNIKQSISKKLDASKITEINFNNICLRRGYRAQGQLKNRLVFTIPTSSSQNTCVKIEKNPDLLPQRELTKTIESKIEKSKTETKVKKKTKPAKASSIPSSAELANLGYFEFSTSTKEYCVGINKSTTRSTDKMNKIGRVLSQFDVLETTRKFSRDISHPIKKGKFFVYELDSIEHNKYEKNKSEIIQEIKTILEQGK